MESVVQTLDGLSRVEGEMGASNGRIRVLIADDHRSVRDALVDAFQLEPDIDVVGLAEDGPTALELTRRLKPQVVVLDNSMPVLSGLEVLAKLAAERSAARVIFYTLEPSLADDALARGAARCLSKAAPMREVVATVRELAAP
jgi:DNA-binding NarL/FixJ family response regulator